MVAYGNDLGDSGPGPLGSRGLNRREQRQDQARRVADAEIMRDTLDELAPNSHDLVMVANFLERLSVKRGEVHALFPDLDSAREQILTGLHEIVRCYPEREILRPELERLGREHLRWATGTDYAVASEELIDALRAAVGRYLWTNRREVAWARMCYWVGGVMRSAAEPPTDDTQPLPDGTE